MTPKGKTILFTVLKVLAIIASVLPFTIGYLAILFTARYPIFVTFFITSLLILIHLALAWLILHSKTRKIMLYGAIASTVICAIATSIAGGRELYLDSIRIVDNSNIDTSKYLPFDENSKIARLDHEASLKFTITDNLPRVDGAAALFPMYSAFVNATYPNNIPPLNRDGGVFYYTNTIGSYEFLARGDRDLVFGVDPTSYLEQYRDVDGYLQPDSFAKTPIGREGFVFFTNKKNPVDSLTIEQLKGIYSGQITNWKDVGGNNTSIKVFSRNKGSGSYAGLKKFMGDLEIIDGETVLVYDLMSGIITAVADYENHPGAIGYSYYTYASQLKANNDIKILQVDEVIPNKETIGSETYPITDSFYVTYPNNKTTEMDKFINWIISSEGQELVDKSGYAPIS